MMKKVLIYAYMAGNFGDDLMVWALCRRYPNVKFLLWADASYRERFEELRNVRVVAQSDRMNRVYNGWMRKVLRKEDDYFQHLVRTADAVVHIGGSVYVQHEQYEMTMAIDKMLRKTSKKMYVCGANFGPYTDRAFLEKYLDILKQDDGVCFRDRASYELFHSLPNVRYAPDIVFGCPTGSEENTSAGKRKRVLISVIEPEMRKGRYGISQYADAYDSFIQRTAMWYMEKGYQIRFLSLCDGQGDRRAAERIVSRIPERMHGQIRIYSYQTDILQTLSLFAEAEIVIGTRFHSIILGWVYGKKVLPIIYDLKTRNVLSDLKWNTYLELENLETCDVPAMLKGVDRMPEAQLNELISKSEEQFLDLDRLFGNR